MFLCSCKAITEGQVRALGREGIVSAEALIDALGLDDPGCCGRCVREIGTFTAVAGGARGAPLVMFGTLSAHQR
jgi:bacterioferritin-associated ferredoxin